MGDGPEGVRPSLCRIRKAASKSGGLLGPQPGFRTQKLLMLPGCGEGTRHQEAPAWCLAELEMGDVLPAAPGASQIWPLCLLFAAKRRRQWKRSSRLGVAGLGLPGEVVSACFVMALAAKLNKRGGCFRAMRRGGSTAVLHAAGDWGWQLGTLVSFGLSSLEVLMSLSAPWCWGVARGWQMVLVVFTVWGARRRLALGSPLAVVHQRALN